MDDLEEEYKIEKIINFNIIITIYNSFIYLFLKWNF
jgi:hypothetical protein